MVGEVRKVSGRSFGGAGAGVLSGACAVCTAVGVPSGGGLWKQKQKPRSVVTAHWNPLSTDRVLAGTKVRITPDAASRTGGTSRRRPPKPRWVPGGWPASVALSNCMSRRGRGGWMQLTGGWKTDTRVQESGTSSVRRDKQNGQLQRQPITLESNIHNWPLWFPPKHNFPLKLFLSEPVVGLVLVWPVYLYKNPTRIVIDHIGFFKVALLEFHSPGILRLSLSQPLRARKPSHTVASWLSLQGFGWIPQVFEAPKMSGSPLLAISWDSNLCSSPGKTAMNHWPARHQDFNWD